MKVALLHFYFEDYTIELANALVEKIDLTLIHPEKASIVCRDQLDSRIKIRSFKKPRMRDPRNILSMIEMMKIIQDIQPDVLHVQDTCDPWYDLTLLFNQMFNQMPPLVTTLHDLFPHPGDRATPFSFIPRIRSSHKSQQIIVHANALKQDLIKTFHVPFSRISVIPHGELGDLYQRRGKKEFIPREPHTLLFFGRIWPYKGLKYLLEAMPLVAKRIPEVKLIIAGRGEDLKHYFPDGYDRKRYEILNDFIPTTDVASLFQRSALTVLPYIESSQSGVAALSYGLGTPVVASSVGGLSEMIRHGEDGFLVPPQDVHALADVIIKVLNDPHLQNRLQAAAIGRCQGDLNWSNIAVQTVEIYQNIIELTRNRGSQLQRA